VFEGNKNRTRRKKKDTCITKGKRMNKGEKGRMIE
jgi:hypothetical protein